MGEVIIGVDTHKHNHAAVAIDAHSARLGSTSFLRRCCTTLVVEDSQCESIRLNGLPLIFTET